MNELFLALIAAMLLLIISWKRDTGTPLNAMLLGCLPALLFLVVARFIFGTDWEIQPTSFSAVGLFVGLPIFLLSGTIGLLLVNKDSTTAPKPTTRESIQPIAFLLLILVMYGAIALVFITMHNDAERMTLGTNLLGMFVLLGAYLLVAIYGYVLHAILLSIRTKPIDFDFIIVNGALLENGEVNPMLASRLDKAIEIYNWGGGRATFIPAGGWTSGDSQPEACAMSTYLLEKGIPAELIVPEDQSFTTVENLENSKIIVGLRAPYRQSSIAIVTSNYLAYRTTLVARSVGLKVHGFGSATALLRLPVEIVNELAALLWMHKLWHLMPILAITLYYGVAVLPIK